LVKKRNRLLIEYQGEQHYYPIIFGNKEGNSKEKCFENNVIRDNKKELYCKNKNIPLLAIPYWDFENISLIIDNYLKNKTIITSPMPDKLYKYEKLRQKILLNINILSS
jgi:hypothetical protein